MMSKSNKTDNRTNKWDLVMFLSAGSSNFSFCFLKMG